MSYQSPHSDINYLYRHISGEYRCCRCFLNEPEETTVSNPREGVEEEIEVTDYGDNSFDHPKEVLIHLKKHREAGHKVAQSTINRICKEAKEWKRNK